MNVQLPPAIPKDSDSVLASGFLSAGFLSGSAAASVDSSRWWNGPLNVEALATGSVGLVARSLEHWAPNSGIQAAGANQVAAAFDSLKRLHIDGRAASTFAPLSGFFQTRDGWLRTHANYLHHQRALLHALKISDPKQLTQALRELDAVVAQELIAASGGVAAAVNAREHWTSSDPAAHNRAKHWAEFTMHELDRVIRSPQKLESTAPLGGIRVVDLTRVIAGPVAVRILALLGAMVLRVDPPATPELLDQHLDTGFGKYSAQLDFGAREALAALHGLLEQADVLIMGYRPGALARFGLELDQLRERYPQLVVAALSAWGTAGPWAQRRGFDSIVQAASGIAQDYRSPDGTPGALPVQALDHATGYGMAAAVISLLHARRHLGLGGSVEFSLARTAKALYDFGAPTAPVHELREPSMGSCLSAHGRLEYVLPPFERNGHVMDYRFAPREYAKDAPAWP